MKSKWFDPNWYRYLWHQRLSFEANAAIVVIAVLLLLGGGYVLSERLSPAAAGTTGSDTYVLQSRTVTRTVILKKNGRTIVRRYPVVHLVRVKAKAYTVSEIQTVTTPQGVTTIPVVRIRYVPQTKVVRRVVNHTVTDVITKDGKTRTVVTTTPVTVSTTTPVTVSTVRTVAETTTVASPPNTVTVTRDQTQTNTVTNVVTETDVLTETNVVTETDVVTQFVTVPDTTTVTVSGGG